MTYSKPPKRTALRTGCLVLVERSVPEWYLHIWVFLQLNISLSSGIYSRIPANTPDNSTFFFLGSPCLETSLTTVHGLQKIHYQQFDSHVPVYDQNQLYGLCGESAVWLLYPVFVPPVCPLCFRAIEISVHNIKLAPISNSGFYMTSKFGELYRLEFCTEFFSYSSQT